MKELVGQSLDRYQITSLLGEGGMGAVLKARDVTLQRDVAVKVMHPQFARRPDFRDRFLQEARTAARLDHPGIVKVYDFGQAQTHLYIVMEFISGQNLREMLKDLKASNQWLFLPEAIQLIRQVCLALDSAHKHGVLHRDIKPDNIMLKPQPSDELPYQPVVTDLGLAKLAEGGMLTAEGTSMGTPAYMSPEQALGEKTDARSDVYSLGILLYELTVGQLPFRVRSLTEAIRYHTKEPPPPPRTLRPDLPESLERIILKAIAKDPADRFPNAKALADALSTTAPQATMASVPPTAAGGAMSLMTHYQQSLVDDRGPSILDEFPSIPSDLSQDRIQILDPEKTTRSITMRGRSLTVGRGADNDLVLDRPSISRHHARIEFDGLNYQVVDLDSTNGTFVANAKLLPGVPEAWTPDKPLRVGDTWLRLERAQQPSYAGTAMFRPDGSMIEPSMIHASRGMGRVGVFMEPEELAVDPGGSTTTSLTILNQGPVVDHFQTSLTGVPADWMPVKPQPVRLMPGAQQAVTLTIQPPRAPKTRAGTYPLAIRVASQEDPNEVAEVKRTLTVSAFSQFTSELHPQRIHAGRTARITVNNQGNAQQTFNLTWQDRAAELAFEPPQAQLNVPEGQAAAAEFRASPRERPLFGGGKQHPFTAQVTSPTGEAQTHSGEVVSGARFPVWIIPALLGLCVCLAAAGALGVMFAPDIIGRVTATTEVPITPVTPVTPAIVDPDAGTVAPSIVDSDGDGLSDDREQELGTSADDPDSDGDGLTDGEEVNGWQAAGQTYQTRPLDEDSDDDGLWDGDERSWGSDPHVRDSDGDMLTDGEEANELGTSPVNPDSDGDGQPDNTDPNPGEVTPPTPTPTATQTPEPPADEIPFEVTSVTVQVTPPTFTGECPITLTLSADITVNAGGEVRYRWESEEDEGDEESITFSDAGSQTVSFSVPVDESLSLSVWLRILSPNEVVSNEAPFKITCEEAEVPPPVLTPITAANANRIELLRTLEQPLQETYNWPPRLAFSADGSFLAGASPADRTVYLIRVEDGKPLGEIELPDEIHDIALSPSDNILVVAAGDRVTVWHVPDGKPMYELGVHRGGALSLAFLPDGRGVVSGGADGARYWLLEAERGSQFGGLTTEEVYSIVWAPGNAFIATGNNFGTIYWWRYQAGPQEPQHKTVPQGRIVTDLAVSPDGSKLVSASKDGSSSVEVWNSFDHEPVRLKEPAQGNSVAFSPDGSVLGTAVWSAQPVRLWDVADRTLLNALGGTGYNLAFSPDGRMLATLSAEDRSIQLWGVQE